MNQILNKFSKVNCSKMTEAVYSVSHPFNPMVEPFDHEFWYDDQPGPWLG